MNKIFIALAAALGFVTTGCSSEAPSAAPDKSEVKSELPGKVADEPAAKKVVAYRVAKIDGDVNEILIELPDASLPDDERYPIVRLDMILPKGTYVETGPDTQVLIWEFFSDNKYGGLLSVDQTAQLYLDPAKHDVKGVKFKSEGHLQKPTSYPVFTNEDGRQVPIFPYPTSTKD